MAATKKVKKSVKLPKGYLPSEDEKFMNNKQKEYYITDYIGIFVKNRYKVFPVYLEKNEILNINTPEQLATAKKLLS